MLMDIKRRNNYLLFILFTSLVLLANYFLMNATLYSPVTTELAIVTVIDLAICLPLAFYFLILRKNHSIIHILPVVIIGFWVAYFLIPNHLFEEIKPVMYILYGFEALFILFELYLLILAIRKFPILIRTFKDKKRDYPQFTLSLRKSFEETFQNKKIGAILTTDLSVIYYSLFSWKQKEKEANHLFSYHKNTGYLAFIIMLVHALVIEMIGVHFLIAQKSHLLAWILTGLDLYTVLYLIADYRAAKLSPISIKDNVMNIVIGVRRSIEVPIEEIKSFEKTSTAKSIRGKEKHAFFATLPELIEEDNEPDFELVLHRPVEAHYIFGIKKKISKIYITVDEKQKFWDMGTGTLSQVTQSRDSELDL
ncbi:hypothetical protein JOC85_003656 [Bacillus mesophilus]|uniref:Beta-carotene 15,15'-monooxygenase n=1 Tax=Bacillus mesophilus TaxID=1808955 RepID=A0A6M0QAT6_9BACI|nr:hypothetical protein [Bacillus mesophilus]MBM7662845.1 hypothetical protein [Bacillus mesophilus]NEY73435.1 hypothetical protein [Bacillus mesophilus]